MTSPREDPRRRIPRTDTLLALPELSAAARTHGPAVVRTAVRQAQDRARSGEIRPEDVGAEAVAALPSRLTTMRPVINATGIVVHTNIGRAPLAQAAIDAVVAASGYVDVELDLGSGTRAGRGQGALSALREAVPAAGGVLAVNNGAAALVLATTALAAGREVIVSRGELVEIGDGFRLPDLIESTGARLREVGTTNRTSVQDYADAVSERSGCILKVHPSNFRIDGFTSSVSVSELAGLGLPVVMDIGSGLLAPEPSLPDEPDAATALADGATIVTASGDKLLGGPQAGLILGDAKAVEKLRRHPLARALRIDKLTLAALEATMRGPQAPVREYLSASPESLREKAIRLAIEVGLSESDVVAVDGRVGGGGAPGVPLPGYAVVLPEDCARRLRTGEPAVLARVEKGRCLVDPRCAGEAEMGALIGAVRQALGMTS
ncbi:L-seryl-tRNA(Sec) selenium transferase [Blastococcus sp. Marseille-P5729]|uniref:L-seryl-tRNA(Sec) selenium transferase n=1 Tax=Blastococcus sp. Marseille-P5729 TaxID=2086582 RepID=UPI000D0EB64D|nr:L-seryl-tRNA(Sec) selenium transferase [Blastococcus sp. Marseille-P5729]